MALRTTRPFQDPGRATKKREFLVVLRTVQKESPAAWYKYHNLPTRYQVCRNGDTSLTPATWAVRLVADAVVVIVASFQNVSLMKCFIVPRGLYFEPREPDALGLYSQVFHPVSLDYTEYS